MCVRPLSEPGRALFHLDSGVKVADEKGGIPNLKMHEIKQSDAGIVPMNVANKEKRISAESREGRVQPRGICKTKARCRTQGQESVSQAWSRYGRLSGESRRRNLLR